MTAFRQFLADLAKSAPSAEEYIVALRETMEELEVELTAAEEALRARHEAQGHA